jgi:ketosteroid isomerase-like protein
MSQENVELTLRLNRAFNRRDAEAAVALWDAEAVWCPPIEGLVDGRSYRGHAGVRQFYRDLAEVSAQQRMDYSDVRDLGDRVLGLGRLQVRFMGGVELNQELAFLFTWRDGKCIEARAWISHAEALEAVGLRE